MLNIFCYRCDWVCVTLWLLDNLCSGWYTSVFHHSLPYRKKLIVQEVVYEEVQEDDDSGTNGSCEVSNMFLIFFFSIYFFTFQPMVVVGVCEKAWWNCPAHCDTGSHIYSGARYVFGAITLSGLPSVLTCLQHQKSGLFYEPYALHTYSMKHCHHSVVLNYTRDVCTGSSFPAARLHD